MILNYIKYKSTNIKFLFCYFSAPVTGARCGCWYSVSKQTPLRLQLLLLLYFVLTFSLSDILIKFSRTKNVNIWLQIVRFP